MDVSLTASARAAVRRAGRGRQGSSGRARLRTVPRGPLVEIGIVVAGVVGYFGARGLTESDPDTAVQNAHDVVALEKSLGMYHEPALQELVLGHELALDVLNWIYIWGHWPVIALVLIWLLRRHPREYVVLRNALVISGAIGVVVFILYPVAPPRLAGLGLFDSVSERSHSYRVLQPPGFVNQYAAIPSLHVGWDLLMGLTLVRYGRWLAVRLLGVLLPVAMSVSVVLTANHYLVDGLIGAVVALTGLAVAERVQAHRTRMTALAAQYSDGASAHPPATRPVPAIPRSRAPLPPLPRQEEPAAAPPVTVVPQQRGSCRL